jgi:hypothetical protein
VFHLDRVTSIPKFADKSNFLHPVLYHFKAVPNLKEFKQESLSPKDRSKAILDQAIKQHHVLEDFLTLWTTTDMHQLHFRRFIESVLNTNLKYYSSNDCLRFHSVYGSFPINCQIFFE